MHQELQHYFNRLPFTFNNQQHHHATRTSQNVFIYRVNHEFAKRNIRYGKETTFNTTPDNVIEKTFSHSFDGFSIYIKRNIIQSYNIICSVRNCYSCNLQNYNLFLRSLAFTWSMVFQVCMEYYVVIPFADCGGLSGRCVCVCVCVVCAVCCLSACVRGRAYVCRRAHCSAGPVCGVCVCRVRRLLSVGVRAWAGVCVPSCSLLSCWRRDRRRGWSLCRRGAFGVVLNCIMKGN